MRFIRELLKDGDAAFRHRAGPDPRCAGRVMQRAE